MDTEKFQATVLSAFPGTGKTFLTASTSKVVIDSDSSSYSWISKGVRHPDFPANYIAHIKENMGKVRVILVSSHSEVRTALVDSGIHFVLAYPAHHLKEDYLARYKQRGSPQSFITLVESKWDEWIDELCAQKGCTHVILESGKYLSDIWPLN